MDKTLAMYKALTEANGTPGFEHQVRRVMENYLAPYGEILRDNLGGILAHKVGQKGGPRILVAGHMDECGWLVTHITKEGYLKFQSLGGWWGHVMLAQRVRIHTRKGELIGIIGSKPPHALQPAEREKVLQIKDMFIDIGAGSEDEAKEFGVRPGDAITPIGDLEVLANPKMLLAKAWDNRAGCAAAILTLEALQGVDHPNEVFSGATVQEEVGLRGAQVMAQMVQPDIAFALDVGLSNDIPGMQGLSGAALGKGPTIVIYDGSLVPNVKLRNLVVDTAEAEGIPFQYEWIPGGGQDAGRFQFAGAGVPSICIGFATRYIHSHSAMIHRDDIENAAKLVAAVIKKLDAATVADIKQGY
jgi:putative aminopeptidase FrvX